MTTAIEYAPMAGASYRDTRAEINRFPIPAGWNLVSRIPQDDSTGFEAAAFGNGIDIAHSTEIVISYAGTYDKDYLGDWIADVKLATGYSHAQLLQAAEYYLDVKRQNPGAAITLTGHSLGGGLAALVGGTAADLLVGNAGADTLQGGQGGDTLIGGAGDDRLYADTQIEAATAISNGNPSTGSGQAAGAGQQGDWLAGGAGDDILVGSDANDVLAGGAVNDSEWRVAA